jgi:uncharacterized integral membrane protein
MRFSTLLILVPVAIIAAIFAVANRSEVVVSIDPFARENSPLAYSMPLYSLVFLSILVGVVLGGLTVALSQRGARKSRLRTREIGDAIAAAKSEASANGSPKT